MQTRSQTTQLKAQQETKMMQDEIFKAAKRLNPQITLGVVWELSLLVTALSPEELKELYMKCKN